jgi:hypothetical protein
MIRLFLAFCAASALLCAQNPEQKMTQRIFDVKYVDVKELANACSVQGGVSVRPNEQFRTISTFGPLSVVEEIGECIKRYDTPKPAATSRDIEIVATMMLLSPKGTAGEAVPADLEPVVKQLKAIFGFTDFRILETAILRNREGMKGEAAGTASSPGGGQPSTYQILYFNSAVSRGEKGTVIRLDDVRFQMKVTLAQSGGGFQYTNVGFNTNLDIREGQKVVVGKAKIDGSDSALVLVISARAVE